MATKDFRKQFCPKGHDKNILGRYKDGGCAECKREMAALRRQQIREGKRIIKHEKQFCVNNHDTFICGRDKGGSCIECKKQWANENLEWAIGWRQEHKDEIMVYMRDWWENNKEYMREYREENKEKRSAQHREWSLENPEYQKQWKKDHPEVVQAYNIKNATNRNLRIVSWTDWDNINKVYKNKPNGMSTDHIIPLQGDNIAGLHVSWNLQYLTPFQNSSKGNKCNKLEASEWYGKILEQAGLK